MNHPAKTPSALIALARSRRMQRALAHSMLHRHAPFPTLKSSLGYMTSTACITGDAQAHAHRMQLLGVAPREGAAYVVEELGADAAPIVYRLWLVGARQGHLVPLHAWYEHGEDASAIRARIAELSSTLEPAREITREAWMLSTRIIQRRALRVAPTCADRPLRTFALQLVVEPVSGDGPGGRTMVTAFLRPQAQLAGVWELPGAEDLAVARISYTGLPTSLGLDKDTVVLLTSDDGCQPG